MLQDDNEWEWMASKIIQLMSSCFPQVHLFHMAFFFLTKTRWFLSFPLQVRDTSSIAVTSCTRGWPCSKLCQCLFFVVVGLSFVLICCVFVFVFNFFDAHFWEQGWVQAGEGQREGNTEIEAGSRLWAVSTKPKAGLKLTNQEIMIWAEVGWLIDWATQLPLCFVF